MLNATYEKSYEYEIIYSGGHGQKYIEGRDNKEDNIEEILSKNAIDISSNSFLWHSKESLSKIEILEKNCFFCTQESEYKKNPSKYKTYKRKVIIKTMGESHPSGLIELLEKNEFAKK